MRPKIEYITQPDELGRRRFFLNWVETSGRNRSQVFFAKPADYGFNDQDIKNANSNRIYK